VVAWISCCQKQAQGYFVDPPRLASLSSGFSSRLNPALVQADREIQEIHRVDVDLITQVLPGIVPRISKVTRVVTVLAAGLETP
jgi:hypothetical protein